MTLTIGRGTGLALLALSILALLPDRGGGPGEGIARPPVSMPAPAPAPEPTPTEPAPTEPEPDPGPSPPPPIPPLSGLNELAFALHSPEELEARIAWARDEAERVRALVDEGRADGEHLRRAEGERAILEARLAAQMADIDDEVDAIEARLVAARAALAAAEAEHRIAAEDLALTTKLNERLARSQGTAQGVHPDQLRKAELLAQKLRAALELARARLAEVESQVRQLSRRRRRWVRVAERFAPASAPAEAPAGLP